MVIKVFKIDWNRTFERSAKIDLSVQTKSTLVETGNGIVAIFNPDNSNLYVESVPQNLTSSPMCQFCHGTLNWNGN